MLKISCVIRFVGMEFLCVAVNQQPKNLRGVWRGDVVMVVCRNSKVGVCLVLDIRVDF